MKIGYSKTYPVNVFWEKNWLEDDVPTGITLDSTDEEIAEIMKKVRRIQYALKKQVESFHYEALAAAEKQMGTQERLIIGREPVVFYETGKLQEEVIQKKSQEETIIEGINSCTELTVLKSYELLAKKNPSIGAAYSFQYTKLSNL